MAGHAYTRAQDMKQDRRMSDMAMAQRIETALQTLAPLHLELINESHKHNVPEGSESHWNVVVVSAVFEGQRLVKRQRAVYGALKNEMASGIHALTMKTLTPVEWQAAGGAVSNPSPECLGGSKHDR